MQKIFVGQKILIIYLHKYMLHKLKNLKDTQKKENFHIINGFPSFYFYKLLVLDYRGNLDN